MIRHLFPALAAAAFVAVPANAATYTGTLYGTVTSGSATYTDYTQDPFTTSVDLAGTPIEIDFTAAVTPGVNDPTYGEYTYVATTVNVMLQTAPPLGTIGSSQNNDPNNMFSYATYSGDAHNGSFYSTGSLDGTPSPDFSQSVSFSFANASAILGALTGSGTASATIDSEFATDYYYHVSYTLSSGFVSGGSAAPEPAGWALLIGGFGAVGIMLRRQRRAPALA